MAKAIVNPFFKNSLGFFVLRFRNILFFIEAKWVRSISTKRLFSVSTFDSVQVAAMLNSLEKRKLT